MGVTPGGVAGPDSWQLQLAGLWDLGADRGRVRALRLHCRCVKATTGLPELKRGQECRGPTVPLAGRRDKIPRQSMWMAVFLGGVAGWALAYQNSTGERGLPGYPTMSYLMI